MPPESNPRFIFTAHCAWCSFGKSSNALEVKLIRPEITKAEWRDKDGKPADKGLVGEALKLHAETKDMEGGVTFWIYNDKGRLVTSMGADIEGDKAEAEWTYNYQYDPERPLKEKPKFTFDVQGQRCKKKESTSVEIGMNIKILAQDENGELAKNKKFYVSYSDGSNKSYSSNEQGEIELKDIVPGIILNITEDKNNETGLVSRGNQL